MKKLLAILVVITMALISAQMVVADDPLDDCPTGDCAFEEPDSENITTTALITGGNSSGNGNTPPIIKCKWEYDLDIMIPEEECACYAPCGNDTFWYHDACPCIPGLQVKPILYGNVKVGYYAVVTDLEGVDHVDHVYADIWHPDGTFKYQIELHPVGFTYDAGGNPISYDKTQALFEFDHVVNHHHDLLKVNDVWAAGLPPELLPEADILDELNQEEAYLFYGEAEINYCQPGGWYYVGVRAHDGYDAWCDYLFNRYWYIPTAGVDIDFTTVDYETVAECTNKWVGGDHDFTTADKPTIRNTGNTPVKLMVYQDDMDFGQTGGLWNVEFDARLGADGVIRQYEPFQFDLGPSPDFIELPGVWIPGILELCTEEKLDFSIHVIKGFPGETYTGTMQLFAYIDMDSFIWDTPSLFVGNAPGGVPQIYAGPAQPGPQ
jgi:hypothetical protein